jgi:hypothetical protein
MIASVFNLGLRVIGIISIGLQDWSWLLFLLVVVESTLFEFGSAGTSDEWVIVTRVEAALWEILQQYQYSYTVVTYSIAPDVFS